MPFLRWVRPPLRWGTQDLHTMAPEATSGLRANVYETAGGEAYVLETPVPGLTQGA